MLSFIKRLFAYMSADDHMLLFHELINRVILKMSEQPSWDSLNTYTGLAADKPSPVQSLFPTNMQNQFDPAEMF